MINKKDFFYVYDKAIVDWIQSYDFESIVNGTETPVVNNIRVAYRPMSREFAGDTPIQMQTDNKDKLPRVAILRTNLDFSLERSLGDQIVRKWDTQTVQGEFSYKRLEVPKPFNLSYQIDVQAKTAAHALQMSSPILWDVSTGHTISVDLGEPFNTKYGFISLTGYTNNSVLEVGQNEHEGHRYTIDIGIEAWLYMDVLSSVLPVKLIELVFIDNLTTPEQLLDEVQVD